MTKGRGRIVRVTKPRPLLSLRVRRDKAESGFPPLMWVLVGLVLLGGAAIVRMMIRQDRQLTFEQEMNHTEAPLHLTEWDPRWPPLPPVSELPPRPLDVVRAAYAFAARKPDVLRYVPCYCGCQRHNHRSNLDCYISGRTAGDAPKWDSHAFT